MIGTALRRTGSGFDPLRSIAWRAAWWAGDPGWANPGNGNLVTTWTDGTGNGRNLTTAAKPTFRSSVAALNNQPAVDFTAASKSLSVTDSLTGGFSLVLIAVYTSVTGGNRYAFGNFSDGFMFGYEGTINTWRLYNGIDSAGVPPDTSAHFFAGFVNGGSSKFIVNSTSVTGSLPTSSYSALAINPFFGSFLGYVAWASVIAGDITSNGQWSTFKSWAATTYGVTT